MQIEGYFNSRNEPVIRLDAGTSNIEILVDTGFNGNLIIPDRMVEGLNIEYDRGLEEFYSATEEIFLASSGSIEIIWFGRRIRVPVATSAQISEAILGGQMMRDCRLTIDYSHRTVKISESQ